MKLLFILSLLSTPFLLAGENEFSRITLSNEIPHPIEAYKYRVKGTINDKPIYPSSVPTWSFNRGRYRDGELAIGTEVSPHAVKSANMTTYWGTKNDKGKTVWIEGYFLEVFGRK